MKLKTIITSNNSSLEVVIVVSVRTNGAGKSPLMHYESTQQFNEICDRLHEAMTHKFHARQIKFSK